MSKIEELLVKFQHTVEQGYKGKLDAFDEVYTSDYVRHTFGFTPDICGLDELMEDFRRQNRTYSDVQLFFDEVIVGGDKVVSRWTWRGRYTEESEYIPVAPTGQEVILRGCTVSHLRGDKIAEDYQYLDHYNALLQLGVTLQ